MSRGDPNGSGASALLLAAGALVIGGVAAAVMPQHAATLLRLVVSTIAVAAGLHVLGVNVPEGVGGGWVRSPFGRSARASAAARPSDETDRIRAKLSARRQPVAGGPPLPPDTLRLLQSVGRSMLERQGFDPRDAARMAGATRRLSPVTRAVLAEEPLKLPDWRATRRPDVRRTAEAVHAALDDLEDLQRGAP